MERKRKIRVGRVMSHKMDKTLIVEVEARHKHHKYKKVVSLRSKFKVHDEENSCGVGDMVIIEETRPLSKDKRWYVKEVLTKAEQIEVKPQEIQ